MKLSELMRAMTPLPWSYAEMDNDKVVPTVRLFGRWKHDPSREVCFGRIDTVADARYACHAACLLPELIAALHLLLQEQKRPRSELSPEQLDLCESALVRAITVETNGE